jgi:hypothetical protein
MDDEGPIQYGFIGISIEGSPGCLFKIDGPMKSIESTDLNDALAGKGNVSAQAIAAVKNGSLRYSGAGMRWSWFSGHDVFLFTWERADKRGKAS